MKPKHNRFVTFIMFFALFLKWGLIASLLGLLLGCAGDEEKLKKQFVHVKGMQFFYKGKPYNFVGANLWYAAYLGSDSQDVGDRNRLVKELDLLQSLGVNNLRILGSSERSPLRDSMRPAINYKGNVEREDLLVGLDFALAEMAKRNMKAVIYLNNFWEWSGGMATYLSWVNGGNIVDMADPKRPWPAFAHFSAQFYSNQEANTLYQNYIRTLLERKNTVSGVAYAADPTIMAWQLANEPRPGDGAASYDNLPAYYDWIKNTTGFIKSLAPYQLVSIGSEGAMGCLELNECVIQAHANTGVDYFTFHMWLKNWGWFDANNPGETYVNAITKANEYIDQHLNIAQQMKMPAVLEEFGLERDSGLVSPGTPVNYRDQYFKFVFSKIEASVKKGGPLVGSNFWAWGGLGKAQHGNAVWQEGDKTFVGDPPQEPQGLNSVFASDSSTLKLLSEHATKISR